MGSYGETTPTLGDDLSRGGHRVPSGWLCGLVRSNTHTHTPLRRSTDCATLFQVTGIIVGFRLRHKLVYACRDGFSDVMQPPPADGPTNCHRLGQVARLRDGAELVA